MAPTQSEKAELFKELHTRTELFVIPNPWDAGSAKILAQQGYAALATTSAGLAYSLGKADGTQQVTRGEALVNARIIVNASNLPVAADLENGYGDSPEACAETIKLAADAGLVGGSIEDATGNAQSPVYNFDASVARVKAAVQAARRLPFHFTLTARAENFLHGKLDMEGTIRRLVAYAEVGVDVLFAPGIKSREDIKRIVKAVAPLPVNVLWGYPDADLTINDLSGLGVKRVSLGSSLARAAYGALLNAGNEVKNLGTSTYINNAISYAELNALFIPPSN